MFFLRQVEESGGELLELRLLDTHLLDTFGSKTIARHEIDKLLESSKSWLKPIRTDDQNIVNCSNPVLIQLYFMSNIKATFNFL
jgi:hypothetical protein